MDPVVLIAVFAVGGLAWWWWQKRQPPPAEDEWVLPPEGPSILARKPAPPADAEAASAAAGGASEPAPPWTPSAPASGGSASGPVAGSAARPGFEVLDRDALLRRDRTFDPRNWDNSSETVTGLGGQAASEEELPRFFDRDYLERKARERRGGQPG